MYNLKKLCRKKFKSNFLKIILLIEFYVLIFLFSPEINAVYTSLESMERLIKTQKNVMKNVNKTIPEVKDPISQRILQNYVKKCEREHNKALKNVRRYIENPISCVTLVTRLSRDLDIMEDILKLKESTHYKKNHKLTYVSESEFKEIGRGLVHLIVAYNLKVSDVANGILKGNYNQTKENFLDVVSPMTSADCFDLGHIALNYGETQISYAWMKEAVDRYPVDCKEKNECPFSMEQLMNSFNQANKARKKKFRTPNEDFNDFHALCRDEGPKNSSLRCQYRYGPHPFLRLAILKEEVLHREPDVTMFHDVISDDEIEGIKKLSVERKKNATIDKAYRFTETAINDSLTSVVAKVSLRVLDMTGLSTTLVDGLSVVTYGIAGYYVPYYELYYNDTITKQVSNGYRHTKIQFFLSDVNQGGATVFDRLGLTVFPVKKSAVIWSTQYLRDGIVQMTEHATCPVLHGSKWVTMEWLSENDIFDTCRKDDPREVAVRDEGDDWVLPIIEELPLPDGFNISEMFAFDDMSDNLNKGETRHNNLNNQSAPDDLPESEEPSSPENVMMKMSYETLLDTLRNMKIQN